MFHSVLLWHTKRLSFSMLIFKHRHKRAVKVTKVCMYHVRNTYSPVLYHYFFYLSKGCLPEKTNKNIINFHILSIVTR
jgi:hypothetical protein